MSGERARTRGEPSRASDAVTARAEPLRIGVVLVGVLSRISALRMLILHMNTLQREFVFELLPDDVDGVQLVELAKRRGRLALGDVNKALAVAYDEYAARVAEQEQAYECLTHERFGIVVASGSVIADHYYLCDGKQAMFIALGEWKAAMAPPSIVEFVLTLVVAAVGFMLEQPKPHSRHLGTRGCVFDFTADLADARYKVLDGFVCSDCEALIEHTATREMIAALRTLASRSWLLEPAGLLSPASVAKSMGYDLFITKGVAPTVGERLRSTLAEEGTKELIKLGFAVVAAALAIWLGFKVG